MEKPCKCGRTMTIRLRTVIYQNKVEIEHVPIYSCEGCSRSEVFPAVKPELTKLIAELGGKPVKQHVFFDEVCELSLLMKKASSKDRAEQSLEAILDDRINELLDLLLLAQSLGENDWMEDIQRRLTQITRHAISM